MVLKIPIRYLSIGLGLIICVISFVTVNAENETVSVAYESPLRVLIIDPGHGGLDGGAVSQNGVKESDINLSISLKLNALCHLYGVSTVMTRTENDIDYPSDVESISECKKADQQMRLRLIRDYPHGILFSIHQNYYPSEQVSGIQVLYGHNDSGELGELLQSKLTSILYPQSRRLATEVDDAIYLMKQCGCSAVLIECGFLSNQSDLKKLCDDVYQNKIAAILMSCYLEYIIT